MAILKQRLHRKNESGIYDTIHLETSAELLTGVVPIEHGGTGADNAVAALSNIGAASASHIHDDRYYIESEIDAFLSGKAPSAHTHEMSQVSGLVSALASKYNNATDAQ